MPEKTLFKYFILFSEVDYVVLILVRGAKIRITELKKKSILCQVSFFSYVVILQVHLVLHPHGIVPTFLKSDSWSPVAGLTPIISTKGINQIKKNCKKKGKFYAYKMI